MGPAKQHAAAVAVLKARLREQGYVEGKNLRLELRFTDVKPERLASLARASADVMLTSGMRATLAALEADRARPVVMALLADPIEVDVATNVIGQGANLTGAMFPLAELNAKRLELLREILPDAKRVAFLFNPENPGMAPLAREADPVAEKLGFQVQGIGVRRVEQFAGGFDAAASRGIDAFLVFDDGLFAVHAAEICKLAAERKMPVVAFDSSFAAAGALLTYGVDQRAMYRRIADYADSILKGARALELRVERVSQVELAVNLKVAQTLGVTVPQSVLDRANRVLK